MIHRAVRFAVVAVGTVTFASAAARADIAAELEALKARITQLEAQQDRADGAAAQSRAVDAAIADANSRAPLAPGSFLAGWDDGFKIQSADGRYLLQPYVELQFRNVANYSDSGDGADSNVVDGFEVRRMKFGFKGNAFAKDFTYNFRLSADRSGGDVSLEYAYAAYQFSKDYGVRFGQYKLNWTHEETTSYNRQLAAERSLLNQVLGGTNTSVVQGVSIFANREDRPLHGELTFFDGDNSANTTFNDVAADGGGENFGVAARAEFKLMGDWKNYEDFTALKTKHDLLVAGGGVDWTQSGDGDVYRMTADVQYERADGLSAYGSAIYTIADAGALDPQLDQSVGGLAQVAYLLPNAEGWEVFGRYDVIHLDANVNGESNFHEATLGVNRYFVGHRAKLTLDLGYLPNGTPEAAGGLGVANNTREQFILRTQFQLLL